jgi:hypothetical protein
MDWESDSANNSSVQQPNDHVRTNHIRAMRHGASLSRAARDNGVTTRTIKRYAGAALVQGRPGERISATKSDRLVRYLQIPGPDGPIEITVRGFKAAREAAKYKAAVNRFLAGDRNALADWHGKKVAGIELITAGDVLIDQEDKGLLPYALYRSFAGGAV